MKDTIELLESIGRDASLRYASGADLARSLSGMHATAGLREAAASGNSASLKAELGPRDMEVNHSPNQSPIPGEEEGDGSDIAGSDDGER